MSLGSDFFFVSHLNRSCCLLKILIGDDNITYTFFCFFFVVVHFIPFLFCNSHHCNTFFSGVNHAQDHSISIQPGITSEIIVHTFYSNNCSKWFSRDNSFFFVAFFSSVGASAGAYKSLPTAHVHRHILTQIR